jgi:hypothetical protein
MPKVASLAELNELLAAADDLDNARHLPGRQDDIGTAFIAEQPALSPLPTEAFETGLTLTPRVDRHARITVRCCHYSVPASLVGGGCGYCFGRRVWWSLTGAEKSRGMNAQPASGPPRWCWTITSRSY